MRLSRMILLVILVLVVLLAAYYFFGVAGQGGSPAEQQEVIETVPVVFLVQPVSRGETIPAEKLAVTQLEKKAVPPIYFSEVSQVAGRIATFGMSQGTFVPQSMVVDNLTDLIGENIGSEHAAMIPAGMVAFPVPINRFSSVAYGISRGDRVNVIVTLAMVDLDQEFQTILPNYTSGVVDPGTNVLVTEPAQVITSPDIPWQNLVAQAYYGGPASVEGRYGQDDGLNQPFYYTPSEAQRPRLVSQTVLQNVVVLNVGNFPIFNAEGEQVQLTTPTPQGQQQAEGEVPTGPTMVPPDIVTLVMWPQDAVTLNFLIYSGAQITLALRSAGDASQSLTDAVTLQYLMDVYRIPLPTGLPYGLQPRIDQLTPPVLENDKPETVIIQ